MSNDIKAVSGVRKLIHIAGISLVMALTLGVAVAVSGRPTENLAVASVTPAHTASQATLAAPAIVATDNVQPELMHEAPVVELKAAALHGHVVKMLVTAYCPCTKCCGENASGITASGKLVNYNAGRFVAADSKLPFGTKVMIPGYSSTSVEVLDRGGAIRGNHIDVFFPTHAEALKWGRQMVDVTILD